MFNINLHFCLILIFNYCYCAAAVRYNPYEPGSQTPNLLHNTDNSNDNSYSYINNGPQTLNDYQHSAYIRNYNNARQPEQNLQENLNYQELYRYYYTPSQLSYQQQQQQQQLQPHRTPTQLWSGQPIVVEEEQQQQLDTTTNPPIFHQQHPTTPSSRGSSFSPLISSLYRNSKVSTAPLDYNPQITRSQTQLNYNNNFNSNNNNPNIIYHRDFRHQIDANIPTTQQQHIQPLIQPPTQPTDIVSWNNQQLHSQHQPMDLKRQQQQQQQQPEQIYASNTNLRYNGIPNDLISLGNKDEAPDYRDHFKRYLENNPRRIRPIY